MAIVDSRNVVFNYICKFYSRIILNKLCAISKSCFRFLEKKLYKYEKLSADLCFLNYTNS